MLPEQRSSPEYRPLTNESIYLDFSKGPILLNIEGEIYTFYTSNSITDKTVSLIYKEADNNSLISKSNTGRELFFGEEYTLGKEPEEKGLKSYPLYIGFKNKNLFISHFAVLPLIERVNNLRFLKVTNNTSRPLFISTSQVVNEQEEDREALAKLENLYFQKESITEITEAIKRKIYFLTEDEKKSYEKSLTVMSEIEEKLSLGKENLPLKKLFTSLYESIPFIPKDKHTREIALTMDSVLNENQLLQNGIQLLEIPLEILLHQAQTYEGYSVSKNEKYLGRGNKRQLIGTEYVILQKNYRNIRKATFFISKFNLTFNRLEYSKR